MPLCANLSFAGYDEKKTAVLLKGPFGALYFLLPRWSGDRPVVESVETDEESDFVGSSCSESYVSSAGTYSSSTSEKGSGVVHGSGNDGDEDTEGKLTLKCGDVESNMGVIKNDALPLHGTVMQLRDAYRNDNQEELPFYNVQTDFDNDDRVEDYFTPVFLGYDEQKNVFLLPTPHLILKNGVCAYHCSPILQISFAKLCQYYSWEYNTDINERRDITLSFDLPLGTDCMSSPLMDQVSLHNVFGVSTNKVYYLSLWSAYVQFVGVAWGLPWVIQFPHEGVNDGLLSAIKEGYDTHCIEPLPYCYGERPLCDIYGLCESQKDVSVPYAEISSSLRSYDAMHREEKQKPFSKQRENQLEKHENSDGLNADSTISLFPPREEFIPRGGNYSAKFNTRDGISTTSTPGFFLRGEKLICYGSLGVTQECDMSPEALARFGVQHGDYLKGKTGRIFEGREAMVLGVHMGSLVVLLDNDARTTTLRNVQGKEDLQVLFSGIRDHLCIPKGDGVDCVEENKEVTVLPPMESISEDENNNDDDADEKKKSAIDEHLPSEMGKPNESAAVIEEIEDEGLPNTRVSEFPSEKISLYEVGESLIRQQTTTPDVVVGSGSDSDSGVGPEGETGVVETVLSPPLCVDGRDTSAAIAREGLREHQGTAVLRSDERVEESKEVTVLPPMESISEDENNNDDDADEKKKSAIDEHLPSEMGKPDESAAVIEGAMKEYSVKDQSDVNVEVESAGVCGFSNPFLFTNFLKAVAYWKMGILSVEEQIRQPLAFVNYYGTNAQQRMMEAVELFQKYKRFFPGLDHDSLPFSVLDNVEGKFNTSVQHVVQVLNQNEGVRVL